MFAQQPRSNLSEMYKRYEPYDVADQMLQRGGVRSERSTARICGLNALAVAYSICCITFAEGTLVLFCFIGVLSDDGMLSGKLHEPTTKSTLMDVILRILGVGDIVTAVIGAIGLVLARWPLPWELWVLQASSAAYCFGLLPIWRVMVTLAMAPSAGVLLAIYSPRAADTVILMALVMLYVGLNFLMVWALSQVFDTVRRDSLLLQTQLTEQAMEVRRERLARLATRDYMQVPLLFGCLPLEGTVIAFMIVLCVGSTWQFIQLCAYGVPTGGWAFWLKVSPDAPGAFFLGVIVSIMTLVSALFALGTVLMFKNQEAHDAATMLDLQRRATHVLMVFFVTSATRIALLFPITGISLVDGNICGTYTKGLADASGYKMVSMSTALQCTLADGGILLLVFVFILLDSYLVWGVLELWQWYSNRYWQAMEAMGKQPSGLYGSMGG